MRGVGIVGRISRQVLGKLSAGVAVEEGSSDF